MNKYDCVRLSCFCALFHVSRTFAQCFLGIKCTPNHHIGSPNTSTHVGCKSVRLSANFATFCTIEAWFPSWEFKLREQGNNNPHFIPKSRSPTIHPKKNRKTIFTKIFSKKIISRINFIQKFPTNYSTKLSRFFLCLLDTMCLVHPHFLTVHLQTSHSISI